MMKLASNMRMLMLLFLFIMSTKAWFVQCPANVTSLANCQSCYQSAPGTQITCLCHPGQFNLAGRCFAPYYPCLTVFMKAIYNQNNTDTNLWDPVIAPFWDAKLTQAQQIVTPPNVLPDFVNNYNFTNMTDNYKQGWIQAYYFYLVFQDSIQSLPAISQSNIIFQTILFVNNSMVGKTTMQKWANLVPYYASALNQTLPTQVQLFTNIRLKAKLLAPCQSCQPMHGVLRILNTGQCRKCSPNCQNCIRNTTECVVCFQEYYINPQDLQCYICKIANCKNCTSIDQCSQCSSGYSLVNNTCLLCSGKCRTCIQKYPSVCTTCDTVFYGRSPSATGQCFQCVQNQCQICNAIYQQICLRCFDGYYSDNGTCKKCSNNCWMCDSTKCMICFYGFGVINGTCKSCLIPGCIFCDGNTSVCSACVAPHFTFNLTSITCYQTSTTTVARRYIFETSICRPGCDYCYDQDFDKCFQCHERYYNKDKYCRKCMPGCLNCIDESTCIECVTGYTLSNKTCVRCPKDCLQCDPTNAKRCFSCRMGTILLNRTCVQAPDNNCLMYNNFNNECQICTPGYALASNNKCIQCQSSCRWTCNPLNISQCSMSRFQLRQWLLYSYYMGEQGCYAYVNDNCVQPEEGYQLYTTPNKTFQIRRLCLHPCQTCDINDNCFSCKTSYKLSGNNKTCIPDLSCNPNCTNCLAGTERNYTTNRCEVCSVSNCGSCFNGQCLQCNQGFYLQNSTCMPCPAKCKVCYDAQNCNICAVGYLWPLQFREYSYDCVKCNDNCLICKFQANLCTRCKPGMKLSNFRCINQYHIKFQYILDHNYTTFLYSQQSQGIISALVQILNVPYNDIFIQKIREGSTIVDGVVSSFNDTRSKQIYKTIRTSTLPNYKVKSTFFVYANDTTPQACSSSGPVKCPETVKNDYNSLSPGAIAGIIIGILVVIGIIGVIIYQKFFRNKTKSPSSINQNDKIEIRSGTTGKSSSHLQIDTDAQIKRIQLK